MFKDRFDAAEQLVPLLARYKSNPHAIVLAIPRGGLELGSVIARELNLPLDIILSKKIGAPYNPEAAIGAVSKEHTFIDKRIHMTPALQAYVDQEVATIRQTLAHREAVYRRGMAPFDITGKIVIVVDDGVATGNTLLATLALIKEYHPKKIVVALPVVPPDTIAMIKEASDELIFVISPSHFMSVGQFYQNFNQVDDDEAIRLLHEAQR